MINESDRTDRLSLIRIESNMDKAFVCFSRYYKRNNAGKGK